LIQWSLPVVVSLMQHLIFIAGGIASIHLVVPSVCHPQILWQLLQTTHYYPLWKQIKFFVQGWWTWFF
jgi:hypothetical protein